MFDGKLKEIAAELNGYITSHVTEVSDSELYREVDQSNFKIEDNILSDGGQKTRYAANVTAIRTLKQIETEGRVATADEQKILSQYVGWGGIPQAFDSENSKWSSEYAELKELLTDEEYVAARGSTVNAHYTTPTVINAIYKAIDNMGFKNGNVLEPAMGVGNFFGCMPEKMRDSKLFGVELDSITGRIAQQLYPNANIQIKGYEKTDFPDNFFDLAVGNVPFGNYPVADKRYDKEKFPIHDYFFAKTLDKVAPGGIVAFITSKGTLDKANSKTREYLAKRADLIGAIRLPNNAFKENANTGVTSDIIFLQKREKMAVELPDWCYIGNNEDGIPVNQYFLDHPEMILGKTSEDGRMYGGYNTTCVPIEGADLAKQLDKAIAQLKANITVKKVAEESEKERGIIPATEDVRNFTYALIDGKMYFRENNIMTDVEEKGAKLERMKELHELRNIMRGVITAQEKGYGGFYINVDTNQWTCFSENKGGKNAVNCLTEMLGMDFKTAVRELADSATSYTPRREKNSFSAQKKAEAAPRELVLPEKADNMKKVFAYLCQTRKINSQIVSQLAHDKLLYQDTRGNAVFVHREENGKIVGAEIQGTNSEKRYKGVAQGTSESVFAVKIGEPKKAYVFESAIDLLSFKQLANPEKIQDSMLVSMAGLKPNTLKSLAESGVKMFSCVDNDEAGINFTTANKLTPCRKILEENGVKDYNELLQKFSQSLTQTEQKPVQKNPQTPTKIPSTPSHSRR